DLADYLKVTRRTIYDWLKHNKIPAVKLVGQWRFKKDKIDAWIDGSTTLTINTERSRSVDTKSLN
ncbi:MAG: helix-turn-helix domain-containing protein, partial [Candidatus Omnitrophica bacterium]|nr:helix-turn-helix domain-containing protein [Candidatus Omnitrophota bacterium]